MVDELLQMFFPLKPLVFADYFSTDCFVFLMILYSQPSANLQMTFLTGNFKPVFKLASESAKNVVNMSQVIQNHSFVPFMALGMDHL